MSLFGKAPRTVYRVYGEDEYLDDERRSLGLDGQAQPLGGDVRAAAAAPSLAQPRPSVARLAGPRPAALVGLGLLLAVVASAAALVLDVAARHPSRHAAPASAPVAPQYGRRSPAPPPIRSRRVRGRARPMHVRVAATRAPVRPRATARPDAVPTVAESAPARYRPPPGAEFGFER